MLQPNGAMLMHCLVVHIPIAVNVNICINKHKGMEKYTLPLLKSIILF